MRRHLTLGLLAFLILAGGARWILQPAAQTDLASVIQALLATWDDAELVCLGEHHGDPDDHALRMALVRHPAFPRTVRVVVVEFVNPLHQEILDRWVVGGEDFPLRRLRPLWRDAGASALWDLPIYEAFLRAIRDLNRGREAGEQVRVVGGAAPIPWAQIAVPEDLSPWLDRDRWILDTVRREVLDPAHKGLAIFGVGHCERSGMGFPSRLTRAEARRTRSVFGFESRVGRRAAREALGAGPGAEWIWIRGTERAKIAAGKMLFEGHAHSGAVLGELVDALIFFPPPPADRPIGSVAARDPDFERELARRWRLMRQASRSRSGGSEAEETVAGSRR